jgi:hypothetical protein
MEKKYLKCVETGRITAIKSWDGMNEWELDEQIHQAATRLIRREPQYHRGVYFVIAGIDRLTDLEIMSPAGDLTEHSGKKRSFCLLDKVVR